MGGGSRGGGGAEGEISDQPHTLTRERHTTPGIGVSPVICSMCNLHMAVVWYSKPRQSPSAIIEQSSWQPAKSIESCVVLHGAFVVQGPSTPPGGMAYWAVVAM